MKSNGEFSHQLAYPFWKVLKKVSRSFYLSLAFLPRETARLVGLAYALARAADTLTDTPYLPPKERKKALILFEKTLFSLSETENKKSFKSLSQNLFQGPLRILRPGNLKGEQELLLLLPCLLEEYSLLPFHQRQLIYEVLHTILQGMHFDLERFPPESQCLNTMKSWEELEHYCYLVAGCVGKFWTKIHAQLLPSFEHFDTPRNIQLGISFGKALQLTNILRDIPEDLKRNRCYLPESELSQLGLSPKDLKNHFQTHWAIPLYQSLLDKTCFFYQQAVLYISSLPRTCFSLWFSTALPAALGLKTVALLRKAKNPFLSPKKIKVPRKEVYLLLPHLSFLFFSSRESLFWKQLLKKAWQRT